MFGEIENNMKNVTKGTLLTVLIITLLGLQSFAGNHNIGAKTTQASVAEQNYDIKYLKFNLHFTDTSIYVAGDVSTTAQVVATSMPAYVFELDSLLTIDSAKLNGTIYPVSHSGFVCTITLPAALPSGSFFTAQIFYHGMPPAGGGFFNGVSHTISTGGTHMVYTVSDPWVAKDWWPAKQSATDKIDSLDMFITVPNGVKDGSNGLLVNVDTISNPGYSTFHWQSHYPIDYYLISIAIARYSEYKSWMHFTGSTDSMLIQNFFMDTATFNPLYKSNFDSIGMIVDYFSSLFGRYPFWKEKYGVCYTTLGGGMENQTMTTIGVPSISVIAHELMHQWFGDNVTYATWGEMWLSEGFATFAEQLYFTKFWGDTAGRAHRMSLLSSALSSPCGEIYVTDTTSANTLFAQSTVYHKGQGFVTMLRYLAPTDSAFFLSMRIYQQRYSYGNASTADLNAIVDSIYGFSLDSFFHQWIYGKGFPGYHVRWDQVGSSVIVKLIQVQSCTSYKHTFYTPVELQFHATAADTFVQAYNTADTQVFLFNWNQPMVSTILNPTAQTVCRRLSLSRDTTLRYTVNILVTPDSKFKVFPNPTGNCWQLTDLKEEANITLTDVVGHVLWQGKSNPGYTTIPGTGLVPGNYYLKINGSTTATVVNLVHW